MRNTLLRHTDQYNFAKTSFFDSDKAEKVDEEYEIVILHYTSEETDVKWTSRLRDTIRKLAKSRMLENSIMYCMHMSQVGRILLALDDQESSVLVNGYRYFGIDHGWVDYVENIDLCNLTYIEYGEL